MRRDRSLYADVSWLAVIGFTAGAFGIVLAFLIKGLATDPSHPTPGEWLQSAANILGAAISGGVAAFVALWILKREEKVTRELAKDRVEAFTRNLNGIAKHDLEIMKAIGHGLSMAPHEEIFRAQGKCCSPLISGHGLPGFAIRDELAR
jgi:hypothetical protein